MQLGDEHAKLATRFTPAQLALFRSVVRPDRAAALRHTPWALVPLPLSATSHFAPSHLPQVEVIVGDSAKADAGLSAVDALNLTITAQAAAPAAAEGDAGAGPSTGGATVKLGAKEREAALEALSEQGWLTTDAATGRYRLGPRAFLELGGYLLDAAADDVRELWANRV